MIAQKIDASPNQGVKARYSLRLFVLAIITFYLLIVCTHRFWLPLVADFLVLENQPRHAELIVVATPFRPRFLHALDLLQKGYATQILLVGDASVPCG